MSNTKQKSSAAKNVAIFFVVFIILEMLIVVGISRVFKNKDVTPNIAGYSLFLMDSNKMEDDIPKGALVIAADGAPSSEGIGKAVLAENVPGVGTSIFRLADISSVGETDDGVYYTLFQEKNPEMTYKVKSDSVVGISSTYYMTAGKIITFVKSTFGMAVCAIVPLFLLVLIELIIAIASHSSDDEDNDEEDDDVEGTDKNKDKNVSLDDFLYGGENESELHRKRKNKAIEKSVNEKDSNDDDETIDFKLGGKDKVISEDVKTENDAKSKTLKKVKIVAEKTQEKSKIDPVYYERASELLDNPVEENQEVKVEAKAVVSDDDSKPKVVQAVAPVEEPAQTTVKASLDDLMKLMEKEQKKLRDQLNK